MFHKLLSLTGAFLVVIQAACAGLATEEADDATDTCEPFDNDTLEATNSDDSESKDDASTGSATSSSTSLATASDSEQETDSETDEDTAAVESCGFDYGERFTPPSLAPPAPVSARLWASDHRRGVGFDAAGQPFPLSTRLLPQPLPDDVVLPGYSDDMPLFERAEGWSSARRCFELPQGARLLTEAEAYALYRDIAQETTGVPMDETPLRRNVVGLRGAYPGTFAWHDNAPDRFNDTLVLLWKGENGEPHVREWPANTDTGAYGHSMASSLRPNRRYRYINGWHGSTPYNALQINEWSYRVRDDANKNGHWDSDRNGWLSPLSAEDYDRTGSAHNIHMGSENAPLGSASVHYWSAGCQVIPGMANWIEFISEAWTGLGDEVDYFLVDSRDIAPEAFAPCTPNGSHACPHRVESLPFEHSDDTSLAVSDEFDSYNCSENTDESGREVVYVLTVDLPGTLTAIVACDAAVDVDIHILDADDPDACLARGHVTASVDVGPGRYVVIVDSFVEGGVPLEGAYSLSVSFDL